MIWTFQSNKKTMTNLENIEFILLVQEKYFEKDFMISNVL